MKAQDVHVFYDEGYPVHPSQILLDDRLLHDYWSDPNSVSWKLLCLFSASQWYKIHLYSIKTDEVVVFCSGSTLVEFYSIAYSSTTTHQISILFFDHY